MKAFTMILTALISQSAMADFSLPVTTTYFCQNRASDTLLIELSPYMSRAPMTMKAVDITAVIGGSEFLLGGRYSDFGYDIFAISPESPVKQVYLEVLQTHGFFTAMLTMDSEKYFFTCTK